MATATKSDPGADFLHSVAAQNPLNQPLSAGLTADPTYLAFLRGAGFTYNEAYATAFQQMAAARATYATEASRLPEQLRQAQENTDTGLLDRGAFNSGERLQRENRNVVANQQAGQDLAATEASALSGAQQTLQQTISELARQRADQEGGLQSRLSERANQDRLNALQQSNQDKYLAAITAAAKGSGGGGSAGASTATLPGTPGTPTAANPGGQPTLAPGQHIDDYLSSAPLHDYLGRLDTGQQGQWLAFMQAQYPGANFAPILTTLAAIQQNRQAGAQQTANQGALRSGGPGQAY